MSDENQAFIPQSFVNLFVPKGKFKPTETREEIARRHDTCEDMAQMLSGIAADKKWALGITEMDALEKVYGALASGDILESAEEAKWVIWRVSEILEWPFLDFHHEAN